MNDAAKAAAVRMFCSRVGDYELAVQIFDALGSSSCPIQEVLDRFGVDRWAMLDDWPEAMWWEQLEILAGDIDYAFKWQQGKLNAT
jgi:hypothetical protein